MSVIADVLCEFLEVAIHTILYFRKIYPVRIFLKKKMYGVIVYQSQHPILNEYIANTLKAIHFHAKDKHLKRVFLCITSNRKLIERYVFDVTNFDNNIGSDILLMTLEKNFRALCLKLSTSSLYLNQLPEDVEFNIQLVTTEYSALAINEDPEYMDFPWVQINEDISIPPEIVPVHTVQSNTLNLQVYIEKMSD